MEEEDEQEDQDQDQDQEEVDPEAELHPTSPSDLGGVPWKEAVELHAKLRANVEDDVSRDGELEEEEEEEEYEEEDEEEDESSDGKAFCLLLSLFHCVHTVLTPPTGYPNLHMYSPPVHPPIFSSSSSPLCPCASL